MVIIILSVYASKEVLPKQPFQRLRKMLRGRACTSDITEVSSVMMSAFEFAFQPAIQRFHVSEGNLDDVGKRVQKF